jgi:putative ABC transport system permease protein
VRADLLRVLAGVDAFRRHRGRAALSTIGVMLAVAVTLATLALHEGARRETLREAERVGVGTITLSAAADGRPAARLTTSDAEALAQLVPGLAAIAPVVEHTAVVSGPLATARATIVGVTAPVAAIRNVSIRSGRFLLARDDESGARVCAMGTSIARRLFGSRTPVGAPLRVGDQWCRVVGVFEDGLFANEIVAPLSAFSARRTALDPDMPVTAIWLKAADGARVRETTALVAAAMARRRPDLRANVGLPRELVDTRDATQRTFMLVSSVTAVLLFLLGGVAIVNGLLTAVVERTPEIGLRRAVGATRRDVLLLFLAEGAVIATGGGVAGVAAGSVLVAATTFYSGWPTAISVTTAVYALSAAVLIGLASAAYPAMRAAAIQPIDALNHE